MKISKLVKGVFSPRADTSFKPQGFFDSTSYAGNARAVIFGLLCILIARYGDLYLTAIDPLLGREVIRSAGKMQWHARVGLYMGMFVIACAVQLFYVVRKKRAGILSEFQVQLGNYHEEVTPVVEPLPQNSEQRLREVIQRFPFLHDLLWGWPFLLGLSLLFWGHTLDGSPAPSLVGLFQLPDLSFFTVGRAPISALNGISIGALAYVANHAIAKTPRLSLAQKLILNGTIGTLALVAWYALTMAMSVPI